MNISKRYISALFAVVILGFCFEVRSQCVATANDGCILVHQSLLDRAAKAVDELAAARQAIDAFSKERAATDAERAAYKNLVTITDTAITVLQKGIADRDTVIALQQKALELYSTLVEKLTNQLNKPRSAWQKFVQTAEKIVVLLAGVAIGGAL